MEECAKERVAAKVGSRRWTARGKAVPA
jgi:hypothetical protein